MAEKILLQLPIGTHNPNLELTISYADNLIKAGNDVTILSCGGNNDACLYNPLALTATCRKCKKRTRQGLKKLTGSFQLTESESCHTPTFQYRNMEGLKSLTHLGTSVGYSALSTYASLTRSANIDFDNIKTRKVIDLYLHTACQVAETAQNLQKEFIFDRFVLFNSRLNTYRSFFDTALNQDIPVDVLELNFSRENAMIFKNAMPHDISCNAEHIKRLFEKTGLDRAEETAENFFKNRAQSLFSNEASYTKNQNSELMPLGWDENNKNIVIFNSSEDEFMAIGGEWELDKLFTSQYEGLKIISEYAKSSNAHYYLRIHPNLIGTQQSYLDLLLGLSHSKFSVIPAESKISTYSLLFKSQKVITFGSSVGIEATYWGKPSILLGTCFYKHLDITYTPKTIEDFIALLEIELTPIDNKLGCIQMANHMLNPGVPISGYSFKNGKGYVNDERIPKGRSMLQKIESKYQKRYLKEIR
jgi:hypothetical protein